VDDDSDSEPLISRFKGKGRAIVVSDNSNNGDKSDDSMDEEINLDLL